MPNLEKDNILAESQVLGGIPLYKPYRYMLPQRIWFLGLFGLKTGIDFAHFGLELSIVFEGTTGAYGHIDPFNFK